MDLTPKTKYMQLSKYLKGNFRKNHHAPGFRKQDEDQVVHAKDKPVLCAKAIPCTDCRTESISQCRSVLLN